MEKFWIKPSTSLHIKNNDSWAELKIKDSDGEQFFDILLGKKGKKAHMHMGINLDQSLRFHQGRGITDTLRRQVHSKKHGPISDVKLEKIKDVEGLHEFEFKINIEVDTGEITIQSFRFTK
jgi:hypothetical protein